MEDFCIFALGTPADLAPLIACVANRFVGLVAHFHPSDLFAFRALLVRGRVFATAVLTDGLIGLVASQHQFDPATLEALLVRGRVFVTAVEANRFADLVAYYHWFDLATLKAFLVRGRVSTTSHMITVAANRFARLTVPVDSSLLTADAANTLHNLTSFGLWFGFYLKKSEFRSLDLTSHSILLFELRQEQKSALRIDSLFTNSARRW